MTCFYYLFPPLIQDGRVYLLETPLFGTMIDKKFVPIFTDEDRKKYADQGYTVRRFKGWNINLALFGKIGEA